MLLVPCVLTKAMLCGAIKGSGPSTTASGWAARVLSFSQFCGKPGGGKPSNTNPVGVLRHTTVNPLARDWARAVSIKAASRVASRSKALSALPRKDKLTPAVAMAISATTTKSSSRVKPWDEV
jgi:hypothetical protein